MHHNNFAKFAYWEITSSKKFVRNMIFQNDVDFSETCLWKAVEINS